MWYKIAIKGHKTRYDFQDLSYELKEIHDSEDSDWKPSGQRIRTISYILNAYDLEHMDKDKPVGKMEIDLDYLITGEKTLHLKLIRTDDWHEGMGVATNLYKWLKYNIDIFDKPDKLESNPFNPAAIRLREKIFGEPKSKVNLHKYDLDYTQRKLDI